jgi:hypothetical protein
VVPLRAVDPAARGAISRFSIGRSDVVFLPLLYLGTAVPYAALNLLTVLVGVLARPRHPRTAPRVPDPGAGHRRRWC